MANTLVIDDSTQTLENKTLSTETVATTQAPADNSTKLATTAYADTAAAAGGATVALDNLAAVQINTSLVSDTDVTDNLGTGDVRWNDGWLQTLSSGLTAADTLKLRGRDVDGAAYVDILTITSNNTVTADLNALVTIGGNAILDDTSTASALTSVGTLTGLTMSGAIQLGETSIKLDATLSADTKWSGITTSGTSGVTTLAIGDLIYLNANDSRWELVDANLSDGYDKQLGIALTAAADGAALEVLVFGKVRAATFPAFTVGSPLYMSETVGDIQHAVPTTADCCVRVLGYALTAEDFFFNPSQDYLIHV